MLNLAAENPFVSGEVVPFQPEQRVISPMDEKPITYGDWKRLGLMMNWSIFKDNEAKESEDIDDWELDLSAPVEDGSYDAVYGYGDGVNNPFNDLDYDGRVSGIIVEDGRFVPRPTADAIYDLVRTFQFGRYREIVRHGKDFDHKHIEGMDWNPFGGYFRVETGS